VDPDQESRTQEAIEEYFSQNHPHFASPALANSTARSSGSGGPGVVGVSSSVGNMDDTAATGIADVAHSTALMGADEEDSNEGRLLDAPSSLLPSQQQQQLSLLGVSRNSSRADNSDNSNNSEDLSRLPNVFYIIALSTVTYYMNITTYSNTPNKVFMLRF